MTRIGSDHFQTDSIPTSRDGISFATCFFDEKLNLIEFKIRADQRNPRHPRAIDFLTGETEHDLSTRAITVFGTEKERVENQLQKSH